MEGQQGPFLYTSGWGNKIKMPHLEMTNQNAILTSLCGLWYFNIMYCKGSDIRLGNIYK